MTELSMPAAKKAAVQLRYFLKENGVDVPLALAQEALARTRGAPSFQVLMAAEKESATPALPLTFTWAVRVLDEALLDDALGEYQLGSDQMPLGDKLAAVCVEQNREYAFMRNGGPLVTTRAATEDWGTDVFLVTVQAEVTDARAMREFANRCAERAWGNHDGLTGTDRECLFELLCGSNSRESPVDLGFEYVRDITDLSA